VNKYTYLKNLEPFERELKHIRARIDEQLGDILPEDNTYPPLIHQAMRYSVLSGGKRIRPALALMSAELFGGVNEDALIAACAIELIHAYSLIHDDLPAMDDDDMRRGKPSVHRAFGEAIAVLAGDALNTLAFGMLSTKVGAGEVCQKLVAELAKSSGSIGMIGGQSVDILSEGRQAEERTLEYIHLHKTGKLMRAACVMGAIAAGADAERAELLGNYGANLGMSFQIIDDVLDAEKMWEVAGRTRGAKQPKEVEKMTYAALMGPQKARALANQYTSQAISYLVSFRKAAGKLAFMAHYLVNRET